MSLTSDIITNSRVFTEEYTPNDLHHRHSEHKELSNQLQPAVHGHRANDVVLHGPPGVGKTLTARVVCDHLQNEAHVSKHRIGCTSASETGILLQAVTGHPRDVYVPPNSSPDYLVSTLQDIVSAPYILVLDEADDLPEKDVLPYLHQIPLVSVIVICHDYGDWMEKLDPGLKSRLSLHPIPLRRYDTAELADILKERREHGVIHGVVSDDQLRVIADKAAGIARLAIQTLHASLTLVDESGDDTLTRSDIDEGCELAKRWIRKSNLRSLGYHYQVVYELIRQATIEADAEVSGSTIQDQYADLAPSLYEGREIEPVGGRRVRDFFTKLTRYDLIDHEGDNRWRTYWAQDPNVESSTELPTRISERI
jgi:Cdc6-like AAA superfamily ATPase